MFKIFFLKNVIFVGEVKKDENICKFSQDLDILIYNIRIKLMEIKNKVRDLDLLSTDIIAVVVLSKFDSIQSEVSLLFIKVRSYGSYQERFGSLLFNLKKGMYGE